MDRFFFSGLLAGALMSCAMGQANVCFMVFQMADNDLEFFIRQDLLELTKAPALEDESLTTWVYFDGRNFLGTAEDIKGPLLNVFSTDGTALTNKSTGSQYFTFSHTTKKMELDSELGELNGDDPNTLYNFLLRALDDCVTRGSNEYFLVFASHGAGIIGFGGDENQRRRRLVQNNANIVLAIRQALSDTPGAPEVLDVLGFDACYMQSFDTLDEYRDVTKYFLASEATEPGHGWAYDFLNTSESALAMAQNLHSNFLSQTQGFGRHLTPKTLALVSTDGFNTFLSAWDALSAELQRVLDAGNDPDYFSQLSRARAASIAFESGLDRPGSTTPSALDIGSFIDTFISFCDVDPTSTLHTVLDDAQAAYDAMFIETGVGPGTKAATGMHITWPFKKEYVKHPTILDALLFNSSFVFAAVDAPNWLAFLRTYYDTTTPPAGTIRPVCQSGTQSSIEPTREGQLLLNPSAVNYGDSVVVESEVTQNTDYVLVQVGIDVSNLFYGERRLHEKFRRLKSQPRPPVAGKPRIQGRRKREITRRSRRVQEGENYALLYCGDAPVSWNKTKASATWDRNFYILDTGNADTADFVYASDEGGGSKSIDICYFRPESGITAEDLYIGMSVEEAGSLGCNFGYLSFFVDGTGPLIENFSLYVYGDDTETFNELPGRVGGFILPIVYSDISIDGVLFEELVGGFEPKLVEWGDTVELSIVVTPASFVFEEPFADAIIVDMFAFDFDKYTEETGAGLDTAKYEIRAPTPAPTTTAPTPSPTTTAPSLAPTTTAPSPAPSLAPSPAPTTTAPTTTAPAPSSSPVASSGSSVSTPDVTPTISTKEPPVTPAATSGAAVLGNAIISVLLFFVGHYFSS